jgi:hypothetical protein
MMDDYGTKTTDHAHRARNSDLAKLHLASLRKITQQHGLDATRLRYKVPRPHAYPKSPRSTLLTPTVVAIHRHHLPPPPYPQHRYP